jgi:hypothetical protein
MTHSSVGLEVLPLQPKLGRVCQLCAAHYTVWHEQRRLHQRSVGATAAATPTAKTQDWSTGCRSSSHPPWHVVDSPHRRPLARLAGALWALAHRGQPLLPLAESRDFQRLFDTLKQQAHATGRLDWDVHFLESTIIRAHQHAAGAKQGTRPPKRSGAARGASARKSTSVPQVPGSS